ncbi:MAG: zinc-ribbon domain-containing protein [Thermoleophilia bacterium]|nr:zinc-ribbon domain-containing protein [Thermoleophilia bacterium]
MGFSRFKAYDYGVFGLFILTIIGVSLRWYSVSLSINGQDLGSATVSGWEFSLGVMAFVFALIAALWVGLKAVIAPQGKLPYWYLEGVVLIVAGALIVVCALIRFIDKPGGGEEAFGVGVHYGVGLYLTLIAGLLMVVCGYLASRDPELAPATTARPPSARPPVAGPARPGMRYCQNCGAEVDAGARFCRSCGAPR